MTLHLVRNLNPSNEATRHATDPEPLTSILPSGSSHGAVGLSTILWSSDEVKTNAGGRQTISTICDLPPELLYQILSYATLPYLWEELHDTHDRPNASAPSKYLTDRVDSLSKAFNLSSDIILDAHFSYNQQWADIHIVREIRAVSFGPGKFPGSGTFRVASVTRGTFEEDGLFFDNVKHLGLTAVSAHTMPEGLLGKKADKMCQIILSCKRLTSVTFYQDALAGDQAALYKRRLEGAIAVAEEHWCGDAQEEGPNNSDLTADIDEDEDDTEDAEEERNDDADEQGTEKDADSDGESEEGVFDIARRITPERKIRFCIVGAPRPTRKFRRRYR